MIPNDPNKPITPKVAGSMQGKKYVGIIFIAIIVVIIAQYFFRSPAKTTIRTTTNVQPANPNVVKINLGSNEAARAPYQPLPIESVRTPTPPPQHNMVNQFEENQAESMRLKSPSLVYTAPQNPNDANASHNESSSSSPDQMFAQMAGSSQVMTVKVKQQKDADFKIFQGKVIPAVLETALNSDLPGMARAIVNENVFSESGKTLLLPKGTRLIGQYNSAIGTGQTRIYIIWTRAITPHNMDISLGSPSTDALGQTGIGGVVDDHFGKIFGTSILLSILSAAASQASVNNNPSSVGAYGNPYQATAIQGLMNSSSSTLQNNINIKPTIHIPQGSVIRVFVVRDLDFSSVMH